MPIRVHISEAEEVMVHLRIIPLVPNARLGLQIHTFSIFEAVEIYYAFLSPIYRFKFISPRVYTVNGRLPYAPVFLPMTGTSRSSLEDWRRSKLRACWCNCDGCYLYACIKVTRGWECWAVNKNRRLCCLVLPR